MVEQFLQMMTEKSYRNFGLLINFNTSKFNSPSHYKKIHLSRKFVVLSSIGFVFKNVR